MISALSPYRPINLGFGTKLVAKQRDWHHVAEELKAENLKLASYDNTLLPLLGDLNGKTVLDYGAGPGVLAKAINKLGGDIKVYDINPDMRMQAGQKIGIENVYATTEAIPKVSFDHVICNLVLCIVPEDEVKRIAHNIKLALKPGGSAYVGFCNPKIFNIKESQLDFRFPTGHQYEENHDYKKVKKEGEYEIIESHRPTEWYQKMFEAAGFKVDELIYTPEYKLHENNIKDFVIFKLTQP